MFRRSSLFAAVAAGIVGAFVVFSPGTASATVVSACGNIDFSGTETCTIETQGGCTAQCTPVNVDIQCSAQLEASCSGGCTGSIDANCTATCESSCQGGCTGGSFSCEGSCSADCETHCSGDCSSNSNSAQCEASCKSTCGAQCQGSCSAQPPQCTPVTCQAACQGSCQAQANLSCQIDCQAKGYANCESTVTGGCQAQCSQPSGALFCNGQFVDVSDLQSCEDALAAAFNIHVSASGSCSGNTCQGKAAVSCGQIAPGDVPPLSPLLIGVGLAASAVGVARRRRARK
jgi:hypothetical protein